MPKYKKLIDYSDKNIQILIEKYNVLISKIMETYEQEIYDLKNEVKELSRFSVLRFRVHKKHFLKRFIHNVKKEGFKKTMLKFNRKVKQKYENFRSK